MRLYEPCDYLTKISTTYRTRKGGLSSDVFMDFDPNSARKLWENVGVRRDPIEAPSICL